MSQPSYVLVHGVFSATDANGWLYCCVVDIIKGALVHQRDHTVYLCLDVVGPSTIDGQCSIRRDVLNFGVDFALAEVALQDIRAALRAQRQGGGE